MWNTFLQESVEKKNNLQENCWKKFGKNFIVYILAASSVHNAIDALNPEENSKYKDNVQAIPGLKSQSLCEKSQKIVENLFSKNLKGKTEIVVWHDVWNKSICKHKSNKYWPLSVPDVIIVLKTFQDKLSAFVYCQRHLTPDIFDSLKELEKKLFYSIVQHCKRLYFR